MPGPNLESNKLNSKLLTWAMSFNAKQAIKTACFGRNNSQKSHTASMGSYIFYSEIVLTPPPILVTDGYSDQNFFVLTGLK
jgi:hypothetical protein